MTSRTKHLWIGLALWTVAWLCWPRESEANAYLYQRHYRWRNDDGNEAHATYREPLDTSVQLMPEEKIRLRFRLEAQGSSSQNWLDQGIEHAASASGPWTAIPADLTQHFGMAATTYYSTDTMTTHQLGTGPYNESYPGQCVEAPQAHASDTMAYDGGEFLEYEYCIQATPHALAGGTYYFRARFLEISGGGNPYTVLAVATIRGGVQEHFRWRYDDGSESGARWLADTDTIAQIVRGRNARIRFAQFNDIAAGFTGSYRLQWSTNSVGPWSDIVASASSGEPFEMGTSEHFADGDATTDQLAGTGTFSAGHMVESPSTATPSFALADDRYSNIEFCIRPTTNAVMYKTYYFQMESTPVVPGECYRPVVAVATVVPLTVKGPGDANGDGSVTEDDVNEVLDNFGKIY